MRFVGDIALDAEVRAIASGAITDGEPVIVNSTGTVSGVTDATAQALGTAVVYESANAQYGSSTFDSNSNRVVTVYMDDANSDYGTAVVGAVDASDNSISYGTPVVFVSGSTGTTVIKATFDSNSNKVVIVWSDSSDSVKGKAIVGTVDPSDNSISFGSATEFEAGGTYNINVTFDSNSNKVVIIYKDAGNSYYFTSIVGTVSGTSISFGTAVVIVSSNYSYFAITFDSSNNKVVAALRGASNHGQSYVGTVSGTSISWGTVATFHTSAQPRYIGATFDSNSNKVVFSYMAGGEGNDGFAVVGTVSGTDITFGTPVEFENADVSYTSASFNSNVNKVIISYRDEGNSNYGTYIIGTVSSTSISFGSAAVFETADSEYNSVVFDSSTNRSVITYRDGGNSNYGTAIVLRPAQPTTLTTENFIGFAHAAYADGQKATVKTTGSIARNVPAQLAAGSAGTKVVIDDDDAMTFISTAFDSNSNKVVIAYQDGDNSNYGTAVVGTVTASDKSISFGTPVVFESANTRNTNIVFDSNSNKMVITYRDAGNSNQGTAIVGTVSGTSISFGSAAVFETGETINMSSTFDSSNNKVVIAFEDEDDSGKGKAIVGTVSGTSISFGTAAVFNDADTGITSTAFDTTNNKVVIAFADKGNSNRGTAIVGTVSGTDISFGSEAIFNSGTTAEIHHSISFNPVAGKMLIAYIDTDDSEKGKAIVGTVSGTSISFGTASEYNSRPELSETVYDSERDLIVIGYGDNNNSRRATAIGATISGTSVSFSAELAFDSSTGNKNDIHLAYDSSANRVVAAYYDSGNSNALNSTVFTTAGNGPLVIGQQYFVQTDGSLGTSADSPSVIAGTAIGASELIVKG